MTSKALPGAKLRKALDGMVDAAVLAPELAAGCKSLDALLDLYAYVDDCLYTLKLVQSIVAEELKASVPDRFFEYPVPSGGVVKFGGGRQRTRYDQERTRSAYASGIARELAEQYPDALVDPASGEAVPLASLVEFASVRMAEATGAKAPSFDGWRATLAKQYGIRLNDYAETEESPVTVRIEGRQRG